MKVFQFINDINVRNGGAQRLVRNLHLGLSETGIESRVVSLLPNLEEQIPDFDCLNVNSLYSINAQRKIASFIRANCHDEDIIHTHLFPTNFWVSLARFSSDFRCRLITTEHSTGNRRRQKWYGKYCDKVLYRPYQKIACISEGTKLELDKWLPNLSKKTITVSNGVNLQFREFTARSSKSDIVVASVGRLAEPKNYANCLLAIAELRGLPLKYRIAGCGPLENELKGLVRTLGIESQCEFHGFVTDLNSFYGDADIFLIASHREGFGLSAVEAMNSGLPIVASNVPGLSEVVGIDSGILIDPKNPQEIANAISLLCQSHEMRISMGKSAFARSLRFSSDSMVKRYVQIYRGLASIKN